MALDGVTHEYQSSLSVDGEGHAALRVNRPPGEAAGVAIALDRQERGTGALSAVQQVEREYGLPVAAIVRLEQLVEFLGEDPAMAEPLAAIQAYRERYGA